MPKASATSRSQAPGAEEAILQEAIEQVGLGALVARGRGSFIGEDGGEMMAEALEREDVRVVWRASDVKKNKQGAWAKHDPGGAKLSDEKYDAYLLSRTNNVRGIAARSGFKGRWFVMGLTPDPTDDFTFEHGYWLAIRSDGAYRKGDIEEETGVQYPDEKLCTYDMEDLFKIKIVRGDVGVFKNDELLHTLGAAGEHISMYGKIFLYHKETLVEILMDYTIAQVQEIDMNSNWIGDVGVIRLMAAIGADTSRCWKLDLGVNRIGDEGAIKVAETIESVHCMLTWLNLSHNDIRDEGAIRIAEALEHADCSIKVIWLADNDILDKGAIRVAEALETELNRVEEMQLSHNRIKDPGVIRLAEALEAEHCKVIRMKLDGNRCGPAGRERLAQAFANTPRIEVGCEDD